MKRSRGMLIREWQLIRALLGARYGRTIEQLMEATGCSRSTVYRDLEVLRESGVPLESQNRNGEARHRLLRQEELPEIGLTSLQIAALHLARTQLEPLAGTGVVAELDALLAKLRAPEKQQSLRFGPLVEGRPDVLCVVDRALSSRRRARIEYRAASRGGRATVVHIEPLLLNVADREPYVRAFCVERNAERTYKVSRIVSAELTKEPAAYRPRSAPENTFAQSVKVWTGDPVTVKVRLDASVAWLASEYPLVRDQTLEKEQGGSVIVQARVSGVTEAKRWVLTWGSAAEALEPAELREAARAEVAEALAKYDGPGPAKAKSRKSTQSRTRRVTNVANGRV